LWNEKNGECWPKIEEDLSDYLKSELEKDLGHHGISVVREDQIRQTAPSTKGQNVDLRATVPTANSQGVSSGIATVIIEVKGNWHRELETAMETQLVERYMADTRCQHGIYLVGWFDSAKWIKGDSRKAKAQKKDMESVRVKLHEQAERLSDGTRVVRSVILDCSW